jgi:hypothetical protein
MATSRSKLWTPRHYRNSAKNGVRIIHTGPAIRCSGELQQIFAQYRVSLQTP